MLVTTHLFIPGPTNVPVEHVRVTTKASATGRPEAKLKLAS